MRIEFEFDRIQNRLGSDKRRRHLQVLKNLSKIGSNRRSGIVGF